LLLELNHLSKILKFNGSSLSSPRAASVMVDSVVAGIFFCRIILSRQLAGDELRRPGDWCSAATEEKKTSSAQRVRPEQPAWINIP
jgi:hypothetical protein